MDERISLYDAKARLSALVRQVREGHAYVITVHGEPVAELRPLDPSRNSPSLSERLHALTERGVVTRASRSPASIAAPETRVRGALKRFLADRD
jgi:prevent-host-death family protein